MTRRSAKPATASEPSQEEGKGRVRTQAALVGEGRDIALDLTSAAAIAAASEKTGFPNPFAAEAVHIGMDLSTSPDLVTEPGAPDHQTSAATGDAAHNED